MLKIYFAVQLHTQQHKSRNGSGRAEALISSVECRSGVSVAEAFLHPVGQGDPVDQGDPVGPVPRPVLDVAEEQTAAAAGDAAAASSLKKTSVSSSPLMPHICCKAKDTDGSQPKNISVQFGSKKLW